MRLKMRRATTWVCSIVIFSFIGIAANDLSAASADLATLRRHPVAIAPIHGGDQFIIANRRSGTVSIVNPLAGRVVREVAIGKQLSDVVATSDPERFLLTDEEAHELIVIRVTVDECKVERRLPVSPFPVTVRTSSDGTRAYVASLWSKTVSVIDLCRGSSVADSPSEAIVREIRLPFSPRDQFVVEIAHQQKMRALPDRVGLKLVVADAFGSKLAILDPDAGQLLSVRDISGQAIRCMRMHLEKPCLIMTHQMMGRDASTTEDSIHWGALMLNCLRTIELRDLLDPDVDLSNRNSLDYIGGPDHGAGDPAGFAILPNGSIALALAGTDELLIDQKYNLQFTSRIKTGSRPVAVATTADHSHLCVVNSLDDSITVVQRGGLNATTMSLGPRPDLDDIDRGERLFHSAKLSHDQWISCASCHVDGHTNGRLTDNSTDGTYRSPKRILSLRGVADTAPYAWSGRFKTLDQQVVQSVLSTMHGEPPTDAQANEIVAYLRTLPPVPNLTSRDRLEVDRGQKLFERFNCRHCHAGPQFTSPHVVDVGIHDETGTEEFNPPSLRGVQHNGPYFHDGRAKTLESVFSKHQHQLPRKITDEELTALVTFLRSL